MNRRFHPPRRDARRTMLRLAGASIAAGFAAAAFPALAQSAFPSKPIRLVVPYPPGGPTDTAARIIGAALSERLKQPVIIDNKPGASGSIGIEQVVRSAPDGHTLGVLANPTLMSPLLGVRQGFDVQRGHTPIGMAYEIPLVLMINEKALPGVATVKDLVSAADAAMKAGKPLSYATPGVGSFSHLITESMQSLTGVEFGHISYKGSAPAISDVLAGHVPIMFSDMIAALPHIKAGKLRALAVASAARVSFTPDVPTLKEQGYALEANSWGGIVAAPGTPAPIVERLSAELKAVLADATVREKMLAAGCLATWSTPAQFQQHLVTDYARWGKVVQDRKIKPE